MEYNFTYNELALDDLKNVTNDMIETSWKDFDFGQCAVDDRRIQFVMNKYLGNESLKSTLEKCKIINSCYHARVSNEHLSKLSEILNGNDIRKLIKDGEIKIVQKVAKISKEITGKYYYCFITKYCSWHNPEAFPIFDNIVFRVLKLINIEHNFLLYRKGTQLEPNGGDDKNYYQNYVNVIKNSSKLFEACPDINFRNIDRYFWMKGKTAMLQIK